MELNVTKKNKFTDEMVYVKQSFINFVYIYISLIQILRLMFLSSLSNITTPENKFKYNVDILSLHLICEWLKIRVERRFS